jgi:hypothetical protein
VALGNFVDFDPVDEGRMYFRNVCNMAHIHTMEQSKNRVKKTMNFLHTSDFTILISAVLSLFLSSGKVTINYALSPCCYYMFYKNVRKGKLETFDNI